MSQFPNDIPGWAQQLGTLLGAGGVSVVVLKVIEKVFARDDRQAVDRVAVTTELRGDIRDLKADVQRLEGLLETERGRVNDLISERAELRAENRALRGRYHELRNVMGIVIGTNELYHRQLGLPERDLPKLPDWVYQPVEGPTARQAAPRPPETPS